MFIFGIYPGSAVGNETGLAVGSPDQPGRIQAALNDLQAHGKPLLLRAYMPYVGGGKTENITPAQFEQYLTPNRLLDLVLCYRTTEQALDVWLNFVRSVVQRFGCQIYTLQITEEANSSGPGGDGAFPNARQALVMGVLAAKREIERLKLAVKVGFSATVNFNPADEFWSSIRQLSGPDFLTALDYVALDFFADVFAPLPPGLTLQTAVERVLHQFRNVNMPQADIPAAMPIYIGENGWPTGPVRSPERQADALETVIRTIHTHRQRFNVTQYKLFSLRDADSLNPDIFHQFGILHDDYSPKPAFARYKQLISELSA